MRLLLALVDRACLFAMRLLLRLAIVVDDVRRAVPRAVRRWHGSLRRVYRQWLARHGLVRPSPHVARRGRRAWNRTPEHLEIDVVRLHVAHPALGAGQLRWLCERVLGFLPARETARSILARQRSLIVELEQERGRHRRRIVVHRARVLWGADLTLVWVLGFIPIWVLGVVDYHGSRLVALERIRWWPTGAQIAASFERVFANAGAPERLLTDRGTVFRAEAVESALTRAGVKHVLTRPAHPWTNGRIERVSKTYKATLHRIAWLIASAAQADRFTAEFVRWYNTARPHSGWQGRTPDEVSRGARPTSRRSRRRRPDLRSRSGYQTSSSLAFLTRVRRSSSDTIRRLRRCHVVEASPV